MRLHIPLLSAVIALTTALSSPAQTGRSITATVTDAYSGEPVAFATASVTRDGQKSPAKYVLTDNAGKVLLKGVAAGSYTFKVELMGYKPYSAAVKVASADVDLGSIKMAPDRQALDAAKVSAAGNPVIIRKDTVEYNASTFKITDNNVLEDLLKKIPGIEISEDGTITANGQTISKITIDGKTFFLDDPSLASKNIPAKIIDKVKVFEKKSEQAEFTGISDGNEETVIDLTVKKGMMRGLFGNVMGGLGHDIPESGFDGDYRFQGAGFMGRFTDKDQISIVLNGNNTNNRGFNDIAGSVMGGMRGGRGRGQGGWGEGNGITTSWMGGLNGSTTLFDKKTDLQGNYLYNGTDKNVIEECDKITYLDGRDLLYHDNAITNNGTWGHRIGMRIDHKFSPNTSILFQPQLNWGGADYSEYSDFRTDTRLPDGTVTPSNDGFNLNMGESDNVQTSGFLLLRQRLGLPGRTLSAHIRYNIQNSSIDGFNKSLTNTYTVDEITGDPVTGTETVNQRFEQEQRTRSIGSRLAYVEPLGRGFYVEGNYEINWNRNTSFRNTFDSAGNPEFGIEGSGGYRKYIADGETPNTDYSNSIENRYVNQRIGANVMYQKDKLRAQIGVGMNPTDTWNETNGKTFSSHVVNWSPQGMFWYDIKENINARMFYFGRSAQPATSQLMPVPDNSNPLAVSFGNPYLKPYFNHNLRGRFSYSNKKTFTSVNAFFRGTFVNNPIVGSTWYDAAGVQYSMPVNGPGSVDVGGRISLNTPVLTKKLMLMSHTRLAFQKSSSYIGSSFDDMSGYYDKSTGLFDYESFHSDIPDIDADPRFALNTVNTYIAVERVRLTYRIDALELSAGARTRMLASRYTLETAQATTTWNNQIESSLNWTAPKGFGLVTDVRYNWYNGYVTPQESEVVLNAEVTKLLFKDRCTLSVKAYDILNQAKNLTVTDASNYHLETLNNTLGRYVMLSLRWRFGNFGEGMQKMRGSMGRRGFGGPPPRR